MGVAAINIPPTPPPKTWPSDPANATLKPPVLLRVPSVSVSRKEPDREIISKRPCRNETKCSMREKIIHVSSALGIKKTLIFSYYGIWIEPLVQDKPKQRVTLICTKKEDTEQIIG